MALARLVRYAVNGNRHGATIRVLDTRHPAYAIRYGEITDGRPRWKTHCVTHQGATYSVAMADARAAVAGSDLWCAGCATGLAGALADRVTLVDPRDGAVVVATIPVAGPLALMAWSEGQVSTLGTWIMEELRRHLAACAIPGGDLVPATK